MGNRCYTKERVNFLRDQLPRNHLMFFGVVYHCGKLLKFTDKLLKLQYRKLWQCSHLLYKELQGVSSLVPFDKTSAWILRQIACIQARVYMSFFYQAKVNLSLNPKNVSFSRSSYRRQLSTSLSLWTMVWQVQMLRYIFLSTGKCVFLHRQCKYITL